MLRFIYIQLLCCLLSSLAAHAQEQLIPNRSLLDKEINASMARGVDYLIKSQNPDGSWGGMRRTKGLNVIAPVPGGHLSFKVGTSMIALHGLIDSGDKRPETMLAIEKATAWMFKNIDKLKRAGITTNYNNWGHAYALHAITALAQMPETDAELYERLKKLAESQIASLLVYQDIDGGWGYYNSHATLRPSGGSMTFTTATVLYAIHLAREEFQLPPLPKDRIDAALKNLNYLRNPDNTYAYSYALCIAPRHVINRPAGSLARSQVCNLALRVYGDTTITNDVLTEWLDRLVKRNGWLDIGRKRPIPHESHFAVSGYFYYFGHYYAAETLALLPESTRQEFQQELANIIMQKQEKDGSWWDFPLYDYHQPYGTGYALSTLAQCRQSNKAILN